MRWHNRVIYYDKLRELREPPCKVTQYMDNPDPLVFTTTRGATTIERITSEKYTSE